MEEYQYYLHCDVEELKTEKARFDLILNENPYQLSYFCQNATREQIEALLDDEGIQMLLHPEIEGKTPDEMDARVTKQLNGVISCGQDLNLFQSEELCEQFHQRLPYEVRSLKEDEARDYFYFLKENYPDNISHAYGQLTASSQISVVSSVELSPSEKNDLLPQSEKEAAEYLMQNDAWVSLEDITYDELYKMASKKIAIPPQMITKELIQKISSIPNINDYRFLVEKLKISTEISQIEEARKTYYDRVLASIGKDGLLPEFAEALQTGDVRCLFQNDNGFYQDDALRKQLESSNDIELLQKMNNQRTSDIVLDYLFEEIPTNLLLNVKQVMSFQEERRTLTRQDAILYDLLTQIDTMPIQFKKRLVSEFKNQDMISQFYDNYSKTRDEMIALTNQTILNEESVQQFKDEDLSNQTGVPIYRLQGQEFCALVRSYNVPKEKVIGKSYAYTGSDGHSFAMDGSNLIRVFHDPHKQYTIAYAGIPAKQLVHLFPTDSFSAYKRNADGIPDGDELSSATDRIMYLTGPYRLTAMARDHTEVVIATPNVTRKDSEFDSQLEKPKELAIYCYDEITENDIQSAKNMEIGIIVVDTKCYDVQREDKNRIGQRDTMDAGRHTKNSNTYVQKRRYRQKI